MNFPKTISLLHRKMNKELNVRLTQIGISHAQTRLLKLLCLNGEMTQADICNELELDKSTVAKKLNRMENIGLISKTVNPDDTRSFLVSPTKKAVKIIPKAQEIISGWTKDVMSCMSEEEKELFYRLFYRVVNQATTICNNSDL